MNFKEKPFMLNEEDIAWVNQTYEAMTEEEKVGQLFFPIGYSSHHDYLKYNILDKHPGGLLFRTGSRDEMFDTYTFLQEEAKVPMLLSANLEAGGDGIVHEGTPFGKQLQVSAANNPVHAYRLGKVCAKEGKAVGCNYAFAPVVDIDMNFRNPITNVRTYGNDPEKVLQYAREYIRACNEEGMLVSPKHFPGDGVDERDQHILTSVNSLSKDEWDQTYGMIYKSLIEDGVKTIMAGHIALPAYQSEEEKYLPATLSKDILTGLLREKLGFNGLIISDATPMVGFCSAMNRKDAVYTAVMAGCDMFLFNKDYNEDYQWMLEAYREGKLTKERLEEAVKRILALKASMGMHKKDNRPSKENLETVGCELHKSWMKECADQAVTLVKDTQGLLPVSAKKYSRVLYQIIGDCDSNARVEKTFTEEMTKRGYKMIPYEREVFDFAKPLPFDSVTEFKNKYDLVVYIGNIENASNKTTNRINWYALFGLGNNIPWFVKEVPTVFISLQNPYHLFDVPMVKTYINCYSNHDEMIRAAVGKINGESEFKGVNPVDPFCGREELRR
ncbi:MAG: glycoside hydrolase family 3 protein [Erysipelotrichales bacterium]|nr:glycoside hydrolase family 3 protein [Erysipelotrichales bacterium]